MCLYYNTEGWEGENTTSSNFWANLLIFLFFPLLSFWQKSKCQNKIRREGCFVSSSNHHQKKYQKIRYKYKMNYFIVEFLFEYNTTQLFPHLKRVSIFDSVFLLETQWVFNSGSAFSPLFTLGRIVNAKQWYQICICSSTWYRIEKNYHCVNPTVFFPWT